MRLLAGVAMTVLSFATGAASAAAPGHHLFASAGDPMERGENVIAVIDAEPGSPGYGKLIASAASGIGSPQVHHTEYSMPAGGLLFANDHKAARTVAIDLRDLDSTSTIVLGRMAGPAQPSPPGSCSRGNIA